MTSAVPQTAVPDILAKIVQRKQAELLLLRPHLPALEAQATANIGQQHGFAQALRANPRAIIAEIKKASPSKGFLSHNFQPAQIAFEYSAGGAVYLSVLTDQELLPGQTAGPRRHPLSRRHPLAAQRLDPQQSSHHPSSRP